MQLLAGSMVMYILYFEALTNLPAIAAKDATRSVLREMIKEGDWDEGGPGESPKCQHHKVPGTLSHHAT